MQISIPRPEDRDLASPSKEIPGEENFLVDRIPDDKDYRESPESGIGADEPNQNLLSLRSAASGKRGLSRSLSSRGWQGELKTQEQSLEFKQAARVLHLLKLILL
jgi:hypothetical protein